MTVIKEEVSFIRCFSIASSKTRDAVKGALSYFNTFSISVMFQCPNAMKMKVMFLDCFLGRP